VVAGELHVLATCVRKVSIPKVRGPRDWRERANSTSIHWNSIRSGFGWGMALGPDVTCIQHPLFTPYPPLLFSKTKVPSSKGVKFPNDTLSVYYVGGTAWQNWKRGQYHRCRRCRKLPMVTSILRPKHRAYYRSGRPVIKIGPKAPALGSHEIRPIRSAPSLGQSIAANRIYDWT